MYTLIQHICVAVAVATVRDGYTGYIIWLYGGTRTKKITVWQWGENFPRWFFFKFN